MYDPAIAVQLRARDHDVVAVVERRDLRRLADRDLLEVAASEMRALLTENASDLVPIFEAMLVAGRPTSGLLLSSSRSMPRRKRTIGLFVGTINGFLSAHPAEDALRDRLHWLDPA